MKALLVGIFAGMMAVSSYAAEAKKEEPETKKVCVDVQGKDGKPVIDPKTKQPKQNCTTVKVRQKFEGTKIEDAKKK
jgi:hypothetical protein